MLVQANLGRCAPVVRSPKTQLLFLDRLSLPKYLLAIQCFDFFEWVRLAHL